MCQTKHEQAKENRLTQKSTQISPRPVSAPDKRGCQSQIKSKFTALNMITWDLFVCGDRFSLCKSEWSSICCVAQASSSLMMSCLSLVSVGIPVMCHDTRLRISHLNFSSYLHLYVHIYIIFISAYKYLHIYMHVHVFTCLGHTCMYRGMCAQACGSLRYMLDNFPNNLPRFILRVSHEYEVCCLS